MPQLTLNETYPCKLRKQSTVASLLFNLIFFMQCRELMAVFFKCKMKNL
jgi:hypothetical protein